MAVAAARGPFYKYIMVRGDRLWTRIRRALTARTAADMNQERHVQSRNTTDSTR